MKIRSGMTWTSQVNHINTLEASSFEHSAPVGPAGQFITSQVTFVTPATEQAEPKARNAAAESDKISILFKMLEPVLIGNVMSFKIETSTTSQKMLKSQIKIPTASWNCWAVPMFGRLAVIVQDKSEKRKIQERHVTGMKGCEANPRTCVVTSVDIVVPKFFAFSVMLATPPPTPPLGSLGGNSLAGSTTGFPIEGFDCIISLSLSLKLRLFATARDDSWEG